MGNWLVLTAAAALGLFVLLKGIRVLFSLSAPPEKPGHRVPDDEEIARRARRFFLRVQRAWDARDMKALGSLATPEALKELEAQAAADTDLSVTEILHVSAGVVARAHDGDSDGVDILFDIVLREGKAPDDKDRADFPDAAALGDEPVRIRELWHIVYTDDGWRVGAIRQVS